MQNNTGPRCCYGPLEHNPDAPFWWREWWLDTLFSGPLSSHYQRYQMPHLDEEGWTFEPNSTTFYSHVAHALRKNIVSLKDKTYTS